MKTIYIFLLICFIFSFIMGDIITIGFETGLNTGIWSYELNNVYAFSLGYIKEFSFINPSIHIMLNSFNTNIYNYYVNVLKIPIGINMELYKKNNYSIFNYIGFGVSLIDKSFNNYHEYGYNEFLRINPYLNYKFNNKSFDFYLGYERQKIINGNNIIFIGINLGFILY